MQKRCLMFVVLLLAGIAQSQTVAQSQTGTSHHLAQVVKSKSKHITREIRTGGRPTLAEYVGLAAATEGWATAAQREGTMAQAEAAILHSPRFGQLSPATQRAIRENGLYSYVLTAALGLRVMAQPHLLPSRYYPVARANCDQWSGFATDLAMLAGITAAFGQVEASLVLLGVAGVYYFAAEYQVVC